MCNTQRDLKIEDNYLKMIRSMWTLGIIYTYNSILCFQEYVRQIVEKISLVVINSQKDLIEIDVVKLNKAKS